MRSMKTFRSCRRAPAELHNDSVRCGVLVATRSRQRRVNPDKSRFRTSFQTHLNLTDAQSSRLNNDLSWDPPASACSSSNVLSSSSRFWFSGSVTLSDKSSFFTVGDEQPTREQLLSAYEEDDDSYSVAPVEPVFRAPLLEA